ncbi:membrane protein [Vibrio phage D479]
MLIAPAAFLHLILIFAIHYVADFWFQTEHQALNKSKSIWPLARHCATYALPFVIFGIDFAIFTGVMHFVTDFVTSRVSAYYWKRGETRRFFQVIGYDQLIHTISLLVAYVLFFA